MRERAWTNLCQILKRVDLGTAAGVGHFCSRRADREISARRLHVNAFITIFERDRRPGIGWTEAAVPRCHQVAVAADQWGNDLGIGRDSASPRLGNASKTFAMSAAS